MHRGLRVFAALAVGSFAWLLAPSGCGPGARPATPGDSGSGQPGHSDAPVARDAFANHLDGAAATHDAAPTNLCLAYVAPVACATENGLSVYCVQPGATFVIEGVLSYPASESIAALGVGSVVNSTSLGYFESTAPFTCTPTECAHAVNTGNSGASGKICEVGFDLTQPGTSTGTAVYSILVSSTAAAGDYLLGWASQWTIESPSFYLRVGG